MKSAELKKNLADKFNKLEKRPKTLIFVLIACVLFSFYFNKIYKPRSSSLIKAKKEMTSVQNQILRLKSQIPDVTLEKSGLETEKELLETLKEELSALEGKLPTQRNIPELLGDLVRKASGYYIDFVSIQPKTDRTKKKYAELVIEITLNSSFPNLINYLNRLEAASRFLKVDNIAIQGIDEGFEGKSETTLNLVTLLGDVYRPGTAEAEKDEFVEAIKIEKDPFTHGAMAEKTVDDSEELEIMGIVATGKQPTAIINGDVYKIGDTINGQKITEILPNMVVFTNGVINTTLTFDRN